MRAEDGKGAVMLKTGIKGYAEVTVCQENTAETRKSECPTP